MALTGALEHFREAFDSAGSFDLGSTVDGRRRIELHRELPVEGSMRYRTRVVGVYDKTSGAVLAIETESRDEATDDRLYTLHSEFFIRGEGGFGGERGPSGPRHVPPDRPADHEVHYATRPDQALIYRLSGDRGRLHSDPAFARAFGVERPILHGLCTYGFTARALLHTLCGSDPTRLKTIEGRFASVVYPGDELRVSIWVDGDQAVFTTHTQSGETVLDQGLCTYAS
jgi:acyl dehydratase